MFCPKCGKENQDPNNFCENCGKSLPTRVNVSTLAPSFAAGNFSANLLGQVIDGKYRIEAKLGSGGMGDVYRATRLLIGDSIAVKILHSHLASDANAAERFRREAVTATRLRHRNIVAIYDVGISAAHNLSYILMEIAEGFTLRQLINQYRVLPLEFAVTVTAQVCSALSEAHNSGIIHRDIKPENIIVRQTENGWQVKVLDFGIAKLYGCVEESGLTLDGGAMGTPQYMSPEQCMGDALDARSDIYSVGIVLYEMLCGTVPFKAAAASAVAIYQVQNQPAAPRSINPNIYPQVEAVILRVLEKQREMRPQTAQTLTQELIQAATAAYRDNDASAQNVIVTPSDLTAVTADAPENKSTPSHTLSTEVLIEKNAAANSGELAVTEFIEIVAPKQTENLEKDQKTEEFAQSEISSEINISEVSSEEKAELSQVFEDAESLTDELFDDEKEKSIEPNAVTAVLPATPFFDESQPIAKPDEPLPFNTSNTKNISSTQAETEILRIEPETKSGNKIAFTVGGIILLLFVFLGVITGLNWFLSGKESSADAGGGNSAPTNPQTSAVPNGMVYVAGGEFLLGSDTSDEYSRPARKVVVKPFYIDLTEVTNEEYKKFVDTAGHKPPPDWKNNNFPDGKARFPVTSVNWDDANAYAKWAGKRLPTEEEWEFAAKGTENFIYPWGNDWKPEFTNAGNQKSGMQEVGKAQGKSPFGLSDMSGNAWEWTSSDAKAYPNGKSFPKSNLKLKIIRGGSWESNKEDATTIFRTYWGATGEEKGYSNTSFRCVTDISLN